MMEEWRDIEGYEGYRVSSKGIVISHKGRRPRELVQVPHTAGYLRVYLRSKNKTTCKYVHRLVAKAFLANPLSKRTVNHIDGVKTNNNLSNLEWATDKENINHAIEIGLHSVNGEGNYSSKYKEETVREALELLKSLSFKEVESITKIPRKYLKRIQNKERWAHL